MGELSEGERWALEVLLGGSWREKARSRTSCCRLRDVVRRRRCLHLDITRAGRRILLWKLEA